MKKEKIKNLIGKVNVSHAQAVITREWFEKNPAPQVELRALTDSEIQQKYIALYDDYQSLLIDKKELEQNQIAPVVVGLSDEQLKDFYVSGFDWTSAHSFIKTYKEWEKTQTFAQSNVFEPNWGNAPAESVGVQIILDFYDRRHQSVRCSDVIATIPRPKPTLQVEAGQVWVHHTGTGFDYIVESIGMFNDVGNNQVDSVTYKSKASNNFYTRTMSDFISKFERVGGE